MNEEEIRALELYEGDVSSFDQNDSFWSDPKAYVTLNSLLFSGISTETARTEEGRVLNPSYIKRTDETVKVINHLLCILKRSVYHGHVYRVERLSDYRLFRDSGYLQSFISTSRNGFLSSYEDKKDLVLMEFDLDETVQAGDLAELLPKYRKQEEAEVLIAPYQKCIFTERKPEGKELLIRDRNGNPPVVHVYGMIAGHYQKKSQHPFSLNENVIQACVRVYTDLNHHQLPSKEDTQTYLAYKKWFQTSQLIF